MARSSYASLAVKTLPTLGLQDAMLQLHMHALHLGKDSQMHLAGGDPCGDLVAVSCMQLCHAVERGPKSAELARKQVAHVRFPDQHAQHGAA